MRTLSILSATVLLLALLLAPFAMADDESPFDRGEELLRKGRYTDALALLAKARKGAPEDAALAALQAELLLETGLYPEAEAAARSVDGSAACLTIAGESLLLRGRLTEARKAVDDALAKAPEHPRARFLLGRIALANGKRQVARDAFEWFFDYYATNDVKDPEALTLIALSSLRLAELTPDVRLDFRPSLKLLDNLTGVKGRKGVAPNYLPAYVAKAELFLAVYQDKDAKKWFEKALAKNPRYPPALVGLARQMSFNWQSLQGAAKCEEALLVNPSLAEAHEYVAEIRIGDRHYADARKHLDKVLAVNPGSKRSRALLAVIEFVQGRRESFDKQVAALLAEDPKYSGVFLDLTGTLEQQRRFEEAETWARKAIATDDQDFRGWWMLGRNLVHLAREEEARKALKKSRELDPGAHYWGNVFRENMIEVLGHLEEFAESRSQNFVFKIHVGENAILTRYYHRFFEESWDRLTKKYGFTPEGPILTEIFHKHEDFAARTIGLPGIGALGACFGKIITLDSPSARPPGQFTWASTAHHEFAHVVTLQLSKGRVPRWFTEGLSVYEERQFADWWERDQDRRLFDKWANGELYPILKFNAVFRTREVGFAYYVGGMMCEFMEEEFGFAKIIEMLKAYGADKQTADVLEKVLGVTAEEYDQRFRNWVGRTVGAFRLVPTWSKKMADKMMARIDEKPKDAEALSRVAWFHFQRNNTVDAMSWLGKAWDSHKDRPDLLLLRGRIAFTTGRKDEAKKWYGKYVAAGGDDYDTRLHLAGLAEEDGEFDEAIEHLKAAKVCFPPAPAPCLELARLLQGEGDEEGSIREKEAAAKRLGKNIPIRLELADYYENAEDWKKLEKILTQVVLIFPLAIDNLSGVKIHARLAAARKRLTDYEGAAVEYEVALELGVPKAAEVGVRVSLGETYFLLGRVRDARFQAEAARDLEPENEGVKELLEKVRKR